MYLFEAHYTDVFTDTEINREIRFDDQFFPNEKECYLYAMAEACDMKQEQEVLYSLEFIAC